MISDVTGSMGHRQRALQSKLGEMMHLLLGSIMSPTRNCSSAQGDANYDRSRCRSASSSRAGDDDELGKIFPEGAAAARCTRGRTGALLRAYTAIDCFRELAGGARVSLHHRRSEAAASRDHDQVRGTSSATAPQDVTEAAWSPAAAALRVFPHHPDQHVDGGSLQCRIAGGACWACALLLDDDEAACGDHAAGPSASPRVLDDVDAGVQGSHGPAMARRRSMTAAAAVGTQGRAIARR